jgi:NADPH:quinone reductase-like Zn-dependent oxidoreductase
LQQGAIDAQIARRFALRDAGAALRCAERGALVGRVILEP